MIFVVGGSGGGFSTKDAIIHVNAPVGSTITFSKDNIAVKVIEPSKAIANSDGETADYYYSVKSSNYGSWTITATSGDNVRTETITVNEVKQYDILLSYSQYLFYNGNQYNEVTGGWVLYPEATIYDGESCIESPNTLIDDTLHIAAPVNVNWCIDFRGTNNAIDVTKFSRLEVDITDSSGTSDRAHIIVCASKTGELQPKAQINLPDSSTDETYSVDISALHGNYYICAFARQRGDMSAAGYLTATRVELVI